MIWFGVPPLGGAFVRLKPVLQTKPNGACLSLLRSLFQAPPSFSSAVSQLPDRRNFLAVLSIPFRATHRNSRARPSDSAPRMARARCHFFLSTRRIFPAYI